MAHTTRAKDCDDTLDPSARKWPNLATDVQKPEACVARCRSRFIAEVASVPDGDEGALCAALSRRAEVDRDMGLGWLYCCDSVLCGVWFDGVEGSTGQDPNVKRIVYDCKSLNYDNVLDPGLPPENFTCPDSAVYSPGEPRPCVNFVGSTDLRPASFSSPFPSSSGQTTPSRTTAEPSTLPSGSGISTDADRTPYHDAPSTDFQDATSTSKGLSPGVKAAIGVLSFLAFLAFLSTLLFVLRRRRSKYRPTIRPRTKHSSGPHSFDSSPTRLVPAFTSTSSSGAPAPGSPLSPPPRLKDRRLLPTIMGGGQGRLAPASRGGSGSRFPASPICAPTTSKLVPRNENAPLPPFLPAKPRSSTSSSVSGVSSHLQRDSQDPPVRPPRPHDSPLHIPDLVSPDPPPSRGLPGTPPGSPPSIGVAISRDGGKMRDLAEEYGRGRGSWGSWGTRVVSPVLGEDELERMGGKYT